MALSLPICRGGDFLAGNCHPLWGLRVTFFLFFVVGVKNVRCIFHAEEGASGKASLNQKCQHTHTERALLPLLRKIVGNIEAEGV